MEGTMVKKISKKQQIGLLCYVTEGILTQVGTLGQALDSVVKTQQLIINNLKEMELRVDSLERTIDEQRTAKSELDK
jgi:hypothetical protein